MFRTTLTIAAAMTTAVSAATQDAPTSQPAPGIAWFGTWESGLAEAQRTQRPILLIAAAPHCRNVSGMW